MNICWIIYCVLAHMLALNRFVNLVFPTKLNTVFSMLSTRVMLAGETKILIFAQSMLCIIPKVKCQCINNYLLIHNILQLFLV